MTLSPAVRIGLFATIGWVLLVAGFWLFGPEGAPRSGLARLGTVVSVLAPVVLIWMAALAADALAVLRSEADSLRLVVDAMRREASGASLVRAESPDAAPPAAAAAARPRPAAAPAASQTAAPGDTRQSRLDLDPPEAAPPPAEISPRDLILSLNFPDGPDDSEAIAALHAALADPDLARVIRAAQDVITLLAGKGIYMDDQQPDLPRPELWRRFAEGMRGGAVAGLAGLRNREIEAMLARSLREDDILRDAVHHFLRQYDRMLGAQVARLDDAQLVTLSDTRSGRAFMLLGRVAHSFG